MSIVLADADSFYASCERVFNPALRGRPVVVLSNNDGCVVARSGEAKSMGVPEGAAWFKVGAGLERRGVVACSSNYELYASLSRRMMGVMDRYMPGREAYSIDECFLTPPNTRVLETCRAMRQAVLRGVGIPVTVTCAPSRTLAKILSHWAKHTPEARGVAVWEELHEDLRERILASTPVGDVWGVGRRNTPRLIAMGVITARDLRDADPVLIRHRFGVNLARTVIELGGTPCISLDGFDAVDGRREHQIMCSRMFGRPITGLDELCGAVGVYAQQAASRLRRQHGLTRLVGVWCATSPFHDDYRSAGGWARPLDPTDDPVTIARTAIGIIRAKVRPGWRWVRAGVMLSDLADRCDYGTLPGLEPVVDAGLSEALDEINRKYGRQHAGIGWAGIRGKGRADGETGASWRTRRSRLSLRATTRWDELVTAHA